MLPAMPTDHKPLDSQKGMGGDMSMNFFVRMTSPPTRFYSSELQQIKGLNYEAIVEVRFPSPAWMNDRDYAILQTNSDNDNDWRPFSLNLSIYNQTIVPSDWENMWFWMYGRVHPNSLTWEVEPTNDSESITGRQEYTIPALIIRDGGYQPIATRMFDIDSRFPMTSPIVTFTGPIIASGLTLLNQDIIQELGNTQAKCSGFVQLSTYIAPGDPSKTPYQGFHPFQVFVLFPINVNPWKLLCKKMTERQHTQFLPNTILTCTGKVIGLLNHDIMVNPPPLARDHVFIVAPDSWTFHERSSRNSVSSPSAPVTSNRVSSDVLDRSKFMSPSKRLDSSSTTSQIVIPSSPVSTHDGDETITTPSSRTIDTSSTNTAPDTTTPHTAKRLNLSDDSTPSKKARTSNTLLENTNPTLHPQRNRTPSKRLLE